MQAKKSFLVIDDSYIDRLVAGMLIKRTFNVPDVHEVSGGKQALDWLTSQESADVDQLIILLDIMMPQMNGFEFLDHFDKLDKFVKDRAIIIMLSSTLDHDDVKRAKQHPYVKKLLSKPLSANELKEFV